MARERKKHVQVPLDFREEKRGGKRKGAGRKARPVRGQRPHRRVRKRPPITARQPVHVVLRVANDVGRLRRVKAYQAIRLAMLTAIVLDAIRIVHVSIQRNHIHLLVEANDEHELARGMKGLQISAAKRLNRAVTIERRLERRRRGQVFVHRYHAEVITSPKQARHRLAYVLNNWRRHREDLESVAQRRAQVDPYSSGISFEGWRGLSAPLVIPGDYEPLPVTTAKSWLLTTGWKKHGAIGLREVPGTPR